ncbi:MAG: winged helix-turn-helix domain-containing protein [Sphingomicrobium sp.]
MSMRLLLLLAQRAPNTATRDEIVDVLWSGRAVTDDAVNKQISKVRSALTDPQTGETLVQTIPKTGIRLSVEPRLPDPLKPVRIWPIAAAILSIFGIAFWFVISPAAPQVVEDIITATPGAEYDPALSPDGHQLAYVAHAQSSQRSQLFIRTMDNDSPRLIFDGNVGAPAWSQGGRLAFVIHQNGGCAIIIRSASGDLRRLTQCVAAEFGGLAWLDSTTLIVSDRIGVGKSYRLALIDVSSGRARLLTRPNQGDVGDTRPLASRDGRALFFLRNSTVGAGELYQLRIADGRLDRLATDADVISGFALGPKESLIISAERQSQGGALWQLSLNSGQWLRLSPRVAPDLAGNRDGTSFIFSRVERQTVLWQLPLATAGAGMALTPSTRSDWSPMVSPDSKRIAFLSNRSGSQEIWLLDAQTGAARRVTHFGGPGLQDLSWSRDGTALLTSVPRDGQFDIAMIDLRSGRMTPIAATRLDERHGAFSPDGNGIDFVRRSGSAFVLWQYDLASKKEHALAAGVMRLVPTKAGEPLVFTRPFQNGLWIADRTENIRKVADFPDVTRMRDIAVSGNTIYAVRIDDGKAMLIAVDARSGAQRLVRQLPEIARPSGIAIFGSTIVYARALRFDADLYRLSLKI